MRSSYSAPLSSSGKSRIGVVVVDEVLDVRASREDAGAPRDRLEGEPFPHLVAAEDVAHHVAHFGQ